MIKSINQSIRPSPPGQWWWGCQVELCSCAALLSGRGSVIASVEVIARGRGGYLRMRALRASWVAEVACCECIKLCSGDASRFLLVAGRWFVGVVGPVFWSLPRRFLLPGGLRTAARISWISCCLFIYLFIYSLIACNLKVMAMIQKS
jgi:hypothetical protein